MAEVFGMEMRRKKTDWKKIFLESTVMSFYFTLWILIFIEMVTMTNSAGFAFIVTFLIGIVLAATLTKLMEM